MVTMSKNPRKRKAMPAKKSATSKPKSNKKNLTFQSSRFSRRNMLIFITFFAVVGSYLLWISFAASIVVGSVQAENLTLAPGVTAISDASADQGAAIRFSNNASATGQVTLTAAASQIVVRAKGIQCNGAPQMVINVDGVQVLTTSVSSSSWADHSASISLAAGTHDVSASFTNDYSSNKGKSGNKSCDRDLYIDKISAIGQTQDSSQPPVAGNIMWKADGSRGLTEEWSAWSDDHLTSGAPANPGALTSNWTHPEMSLEQVVGTVLPGKKSYRVFAPVGETRHELKMAHPVRPGFENHVFSEGQEVWISWATKMTVLTKQDTGWWMINQFRHVNESGLTTGGSPHGLGMRSNATYQWTSDPSIYPGAVLTHDTGIPIVVGQTVKWTFHVKWSSNHEIGFMEVFADDGSGWKNVVPKRMQATLLFNSSTGTSGKNHMRFGVYRADTLAGYPAESFMAGLNVATTRQLAEYTAFSQ